MIATAPGPFQPSEYGIIKILIIEDNPRDAELCVMLLERAGIATEIVVAADEAEIRASLPVFAPDVVLCDFTFPNLDGFAAQRIVREVYADTPLIFVSGTISEEYAVTALQSGAVDYVLKANLKRLPSAVSRAVRESRDRRKLEVSLRSAEERSRQHAERLEALWRIANNPSLRDTDMLLAMLNQATASIWPTAGARGTLWRTRGPDMTVEASSEFGDTRLGPFAMLVGDVVPIAGTGVGYVLAHGGGTHSWSDLSATPDGLARALVARARSLVVTTFDAGGTSWALSFASGHATTDPLSSQEEAYVEVLASFFANHVQQRWQFDRIQYQQSHDVLTGLLNRSEFRSQVRIAVRTDTASAIVLVDVDLFREINETYGHMIGDAVLVEVGNALQQRALPSELVGRIGGDIFAIYIADAASKEGVRERVRDFAGVFARAFSTGDREGKKFIERSASFGIAVAPEDGSLIDTLFSRADTALIAAKRADRGSVVFYEAGMENEAQRRATLRNELADAIAGNQFELFYQPHVYLPTGAVSGCEALIRWNHPVRGLLLPAEFIPFAEQTGIITRIDDWVMRCVFSAVNELTVSRPEFRVYFNLSGRQAGDPRLVRSFINAARNGVLLKNLGVEITETDAMRNVAATRRVCRALRRLNVSIAIDDFGTGYSSLSSLEQLPVDIVKIDRSFISGVVNDRHDGTIAQTIISIADRFGFESLGEGAEQADEISWLRDNSCGYVQGYAVCYPLPIDAFKTWLAERVGQ